MTGDGCGVDGDRKIKRKKKGRDGKRERVGRRTAILRRRGAWISRKGGMRKKHIMQISAGSLAFQNSGKEITKSGEKHIFGRRQIHSHSLDRKLSLSLSLSLSLPLSLSRKLAHPSPPLSRAFALNASLLSYFLPCDFYFCALSASDLMI